MFDIQQESIQAQESFVLSVLEELCTWINERKIKRSQLAERLGCTRELVVDILDGETDLTLRQLAQIAHVVGATLEAPKFLP
jgi:plasmid maintenance system antidote protein VapI